ncbi:DeoR/GlpR family DNA-binding transcription regulator [Flavitalea sp.]|nr:DeoR/GlpR family DNA-binding transcription regulator [Flavitalea sp.]
MIKEERLKRIMREVNIHNKVLSVDLSRLLNVSEDTIRRDLKDLVNLGKIAKVHGGGISLSFALSFNHTNNNEIYALEEKQQIAQKTKTLLKKDMTILIEGGTTILEIAKSIPENLNATFFSLSPQVGVALAKYENLEVVCIGGKINKNAYLYTGASVINQLADMKVDLCLIGANGFSIEEGLTDSDWEVVQVLKAMIRSSHKVAVVCISEKLNTGQRMKICDTNSINYLITELPPDDSQLLQYRNANITVI